ncbi:MAG: hypothetical protein IPM14_11920 [bacterium]|nr:hypothetical protein [bacterium]
MSWKTFFQDSKSRIEFIITIIVMIPLLSVFSRFLLFIEEREGVVLNDPLLNLFNPVDLTWATFALIYVALIIFLVSIIKEPKKLMIALQTYGLMVFFRGVAMYLTPFNAPEKIILLHDPFVQFFGDGGILTKDLFFSGHTGTMFLLFLLVDNKTLKTIFLVATILVGSAVLLQHVHYTVDVFVAPFVAYGSYRIIKKLHSTLIEEKGN